MLAKKKSDHQIQHLGGAFQHNFAPFGKVLNKAIFKCWGGGGEGVLKL